MKALLLLAVWLGVTGYAAPAYQPLTLYVGVASWTADGEAHIAAFPWAEANADRAREHILREFRRRLPDATLTTLRVEPVEQALVDAVCRSRLRTI